MESTRQAAAVAYLGYRDASEQDGGLTDWLWANVPGLMEEMAFLQTIPSDRVPDGGVEVSWCPTRNLEDGQEYQPVYSGAWRMENDCLRLELSAGWGPPSAGASQCISTSPASTSCSIGTGQPTPACPFSRMTPTIWN